MDIGSSSIDSKELKMTQLKVLLATLFFSCLSLSSLWAEPQQTKILISKSSDNPALNRAIEGIIDGLAENGLITNQNLTLRIESAQGNFALASQIATKFSTQEPDLFVGLGTISSMSLSKYATTGKIPLVFASVTDPLSSKLVNDISSPGKNTTGVSDAVDLEGQLDLFREIQPNLKRLGVIYNPGEQNSVTSLARLEPLCKSKGIQLIKQSAAKTSDIPQATTKLINQVDAIFIDNDNTALSALQSIIKIATERKIPVYVSDTDAVELGTLAALGPNQYDLGKQAARMMIDILNGKAAGSIKVEHPSKTELFLNAKAASKVGIELSPELKKRATTLFSESSE